MENILKDIRYAVRMLARNPGFSLIAVLALALGIGANSAIFSVVNAVLLNPLPYREPDRLAMIYHKYPDINLMDASLSPPSYVEYRDTTASFERVAVGAGWGVNLTGAGEPERLQGARLSASFLSTLGVEPALGRNFIPEEEQPGKNNVVILSHGLWQRQFGGDQGILGKTITLDGNGYEVVGVMPPGFSFFREVDIWSPLAFTPEQLAADNHGNENLLGIARLKQGVSLAQAQSEMDSLADQLRQQFYRNTNWGISLVGMREQLVGDIQPALLILLAAVGCVLLIACANVANLLLARAASRQKEISIRAALGATRLRVIRQLLTESLLLAALGGVIGLALAYGGVKLLIAGIPPDIAQFIPGWKSIGIDSRVLLFTLAASMLTGIIFGVIPAIKTSKADLNETLKEGGRGAASGSRSHALLNLFVVAEVAISLVLLIGAGLLVRSFINLQEVKPGFNPQGVLTMQMSLPQSKYRERFQQAAFFDEALRKISSLPGVQSAGVVDNVPMGGNNSQASFMIEGLEIAPGQSAPHGDRHLASPDYFKAIGISLIRGRFFSHQDTADSLPVAIIDETLAERYWPGEDPIGKRMGAFFDRINGQVRIREIVGVVSHVKQYGLDGTSRVQYYFPLSQRPQSAMFLVVRTSSEPSSMVASVRGAIQSIDSDQPIFSVKTMEAIVSGSMAQKRFATFLLGIFAVVAMLLASIGIYGVMSYSVSQRTHEIGIRMALGANRSDVLRLVVGRGMLLAVIGVALGLAAAFWATSVMSSLLFGVTATDVTTFVAIPMALAAVASVASYLPARRATRVDPMAALRCE